MKRLWMRIAGLTISTAILLSMAWFWSRKVTVPTVQIPSTQQPTEQPMQNPTIYPSYPDHGPAPELQNTVWLNTDQALHLADLKGKVILLDMWTFG